MGRIAELFAWLHLLPSIAGLVVSAANLGRSRWAILLTGGFAAQMLAQAFYRVAAYAIGAGLLRPAGAGAGFALASMIGLVGGVAIVMGVAGLLRDMPGC